MGDFNYGFPNPDSSPWTIFLALIGFLFVSSKLISFLRLIFSLFILPGTPVSPLPIPQCTTPQLDHHTNSIPQLRDFGPRSSWAVVTGASDGIGKEFALQLSQRGFNILLVSRTESKLQSLAETIQAKSPRPNATKILAMDFASNNDADYQKLKEVVDTLDVAILINNVGKSHDIPVPFTQTSQDEMRDIITINCMATLRVTQIVAAGMIQRKRGLILTMGSFGGLLPTPLLATYSGSKAFLQQWSTALGSELGPQGITVELVQSYLVTSAMSKIRKPSWMVPSARSFVKAVLGRLGRTGGAQGWGWTSTPFWSHAIMQWGLATFAGLSSQLVVGVNKSMHEGIRKRALKKMEREKAKKAS